MTDVLYITIKILLYCYGSFLCCYTSGRAKLCVYVIIIRSHNLCKLDFHPHYSAAFNIGLSIVSNSDAVFSVCPLCLVISEVWVLICAVLLLNHDCACLIHLRISPKENVVWTKLYPIHEVLLHAQSSTPTSKTIIWKIPEKVGIGFWFSFMAL